MSLDGQFDLRNWEPTPKNARIRQCRAPNRLRVGGVRIVIDGNELAEDEMQRLAQADGFENLAAFYRFWQATHGDAQGHVNFAGQIIHWRQA